MKKVFHLGSLLKIHRDRNILELTISPTDSGHRLYIPSIFSNTIVSQAKTTCDVVYAIVSQKVCCIKIDIRSVLYPNVEIYIREFVECARALDGFQCQSYEIFPLYDIASIYFFIDLISEMYLVN